MTVALTALSSLVALAAVYVVGDAALAALSLKERYGAGISFLFGMSICGLYANILLILGSFYPLMFDLPIAIVSLWALYRFLRKRRASLTWPALEIKARAAGRAALAGGPVLWSVLLAVGLFILLTCVPISSMDALYYHLPFAQDFLHSHRLNDPILGMTHYGLGFMPAFAEVSFAAIATLSLAPDITVPVIALNAAVLVVLLSSLHSLSRAFIASSRIRMLVLLLLFITPLFRDSVLFVGYIDLFVACFSVIGLLLVCRGLFMKQHAALYLGAVFLGVSIAAKYPADITLSYVALMSLAYVCIKRDRRLARSFYPAAIILVAVAGYWYAKNAILHLNPLYPMFSGAGPDDFARNTHYLPHQWWARLSYPALVYAPFLFVPVYPKLSIFEFLLVACAIIGSGALVVRRKASAWVYALLGFVLYFSWIVSFISDDVRYSLPALIVSALLVGIVLEAVLPLVSWLSERMLMRGAAVLFIALLPFMLGSYRDRFDELRGKLSPSAYVEKEYPGISADAYANAIRIR